MMRLSVEEVGSGLHPSETVVVIKAVHGQERLTISKDPFRMDQLRLVGR